MVIEYKTPESEGWENVKIDPSVVVVHCDQESYEIHERKDGLRISSMTSDCIYFISQPHGGVLIDTLESLKGKLNDTPTT